jgi:hypothetical protein
MTTATRKMKAQLPSAVTTKAVGVSRRVRGALAPERNRQWWQHTPTPSIPALAGWAGSCPCSGWKGALCEAPGPERSRHYDHRTLFRWSAWSLFLRVTKCLWARIQMFSVWLPLLAIVSGLSTQDVCSRGGASAFLYKNYQDLRRPFIKQSWRMHSVVICGKQL